MVEFSHEPIDTSPLLQRATTPQCGAVVLFLGVTREFTQGRQTLQLRYEAYEEMALKELTEMEETARQRWPLTECLIVHRLGLVPLGEASVAIVTASPHRKEAFSAGEWLIDRLKERVPIWKQEHWANGSTEWVHPTEK